MVSDAGGGEGVWGSGVDGVGEERRGARRSVGSGESSALLNSGGETLRT